MEPVEVIILVVFALAFIKIMIIDNLSLFKAQLIHDAHELVNGLTTWRSLALILLIAYPILLFLLYHFINFTSSSFRKRNERKFLTSHNKRLAIPFLLREEVGALNFEKLQEITKDLVEKIKLCEEVKELSHFKDSLLSQLEKVQLRTKELEHAEKLGKIKEERDIVHKQVELLEQKKQELEREKQHEITEIWRSLKGYEINVFVKEDLEKHEIDALLKSKFISVNEYCVFEKKLITVILKRTMHHSSTHTFLVWSVGRLLESLPKVSYILEHDTRDADITFKCKKETYALEVETGTLLSKKHQLRAKVSYLNRKYPGKWMFVVSNKNLASKYSKFGPVSTRKDVEKKLRKMLKLAT